MQLKTSFRNPPTEAELAAAQEASFASWRDASDGVADAYRCWGAAPRGERFMAHAAYLAALEREELAASVCQALAERRREGLTGGPRRRRHRIARA